VSKLSQYYFKLKNLCNIFESKTKTALAIPKKQTKIGSLFAEVRINYLLSSTWDESRETTMAEPVPIA
jgi:hypothetical protein